MEKTKDRLKISAGDQYNNIMISSNNKIKFRADAVAVVGE